MATQFYAHTDPRFPEKLPEEPGVQWQLLKDHLMSVADLAKQLALSARPDDKGFAQLAYITGLLHDLGKYQRAFQVMLREVTQGKPKKQVLHSVYGAAFAKKEKLYNSALTILGHHSGLSALTELKNNVRENHEILATELWVCDACKDLNYNPVQFPVFPKISGDCLLDYELETRMLFSCLIDADRLDSAGYRNYVTPLLPAGEYLERLLSYIQTYSKNNKSNLNPIREEILLHCMNAASYQENLLSLAVPTGGGKTLSSLAFALKRAIQRADEIQRIILVVPFLSVIEQNAGVYKKVLGEDVVVEHHSGEFDRSGKKDDFTESEEDEFSNDWQTQLAKENWDAPIIVTTSVRFFESLFSNKPSDLRRIHNIARSVVILDEVQTLPKVFVGTLLSVMRQLANHWQTTFVFCTATQPAFEKNAGSNDQDIRWPQGTIRPIISPEHQIQLAESLKRVINPEWPKPEEKTSWNQVASWLISESQALCIVNTKSQARNLFNLLKTTAFSIGLEESAVFHLSTRMCPQHRRDWIEEIKLRLTDSTQRCLVVSTQLVEAGVDIDFPAVYRAMAPFDSLIQAAGRCDREGKLTAKMGKPAGRLIVFEPEENKSPYPEAVDITRMMINQGELSIHNPSHVQKYFNYLYEGDRDPNDIESLRRKLDFPEVNNRFAMIDDQTTAVLVPYNEEAEILFDELIHQHGFDRNLMRQLQKYQVGLYPYEFNEAKQTGSIMEIWPGANIWQCRKTCYLPDVGMVIQTPEPEDMII
jgi:CRISPR-associated endonuclease/helicase Cas3